MLAVCKPKLILKKWRNFIVNGEIISSSRYRLNGKFDISASDIPIDILNFIEKCCEEYQPHNVFVMDIGFIINSYKIIDCNCFYGTGFYGHDIDKIVKNKAKYVLKHQKKAGRKISSPR